MARFFSKIRYTFINKDTSKYLKYAIGEIVLVVLGILIALSINNWNQRRLDKIKAQEYLQRISNDLQMLTKITQEDAETAKEVTEYIVKSVQILKKGSLSLTGKDTLDFALNKFFQFAGIPDELDSFEEMKSTGQLGLISNTQLREDLNFYLRRLEKTSNIYDQASISLNETAIFDKYVMIQDYDNMTDNLIYDFDKMASDEALINTLSRYGFSWRSKQYFSQILNGATIEMNEKLIQELSLQQ